jgi:hypothetical protein
MIRPALARLTGRWVWGRPRRAAALLESFELAEASSMLDLLAAARATPSRARRALYLRHALDEDRHAHVFAARARELRDQAGAPAPPPRSADFDALYDRLGEVGFLAFVHHGERRGRAQFVAHREEQRRRGDARGEALFAAIIEDEARHAEYTGALLRELAGSESATRRALRRVILRELLWRWRRAGRVLARAIFTAMSALLYLLIAPGALVYRALRRSRRGWLPPERP